MWHRFVTENIFFTFMAIFVKRAMNSFDSFFYHENFERRRLGWQTLIAYWIQGLQWKDFDIADFCWKIGKDLPCVVRLKSSGALLCGKRPLQMFIFRFVTKLMSAISLCRIPFVRKMLWLIMIYCLFKTDVIHS